MIPPELNRRNEKAYIVLLISQKDYYHFKSMRFGMERFRSENL